VSDCPGYELMASLTFDYGCCFHLMPPVNLDQFKAFSRCCNRWNSSYWDSDRLYLIKGPSMQLIDHPGNLQGRYIEFLFGYGIHTLGDHHVGHSRDDVCDAGWVQYWLFVRSKGKQFVRRVDDFVIFDKLKLRYVSCLCLTEYAPHMCQQTRLPFGGSSRTWSTC